MKWSKRHREEPQSSKVTLEVPKMEPWNSQVIRKVSYDTRSPSTDVLRPERNVWHDLFQDLPRT